MTDRLERKPPYMQVVDDLRKRIIKGQLKPGDKIPSARQLMADWDISQGTAMKVISTLKGEGLVEPRPGLGTVVTRQIAISGRDDFTRAVQTGRIHRDGEYGKIISATIVTAPDDVAHALGLEHGARVIRRQRVRYSADHKPLATSISYHDVAIAEQAPDLLKTEPIPSGPRYVEEITGRRGTSGLDRLRARLATEDEARLLELDTPAAVLVSRTSLTTDDGEMVEYGESVSPPEQEVSYSYQVDRPE
jgi:DNA-binding GntR family transcriptional regulator